MFFHLPSGDKYMILFGRVIWAWAKVGLSANMFQLVKSHLLRSVLDMIRLYWASLIVQPMPHGAGTGREFNTCRGVYTLDTVEMFLETLKASDACTVSKGHQKMYFSYFFLSSSRLVTRSHLRFFLLFFASSLPPSMWLQTRLLALAPPIKNSRIQGALPYVVAACCSRWLLITYTQPPNRFGGIISNKRCSSK